MLRCFRDTKNATKGIQVGIKGQLVSKAHVCDIVTHLQRFMLARPNYDDSDNVRLTVTSVTSSSVELQWGQQPDLPQGIPDLGEYYGYLLTYRPNDTWQHTQYGSYSHNRERNSLTEVVGGLDYYHSYTFEVEPYRVWEGAREYGSRYPLATATTLCRGKSLYRVSSLV